MQVINSLPIHIFQTYTKLKGGSRQGEQKAANNRVPLTGLNYTTKDMLIHWERLKVASTWGLDVSML